MAGLSLALVLVVGLVVVLLVRDEDHGTAPPTTTVASPARAADTLRALEDAVASADPDAAAALAPPDDDAARERLAAIATNAGALRVRDFSLRYVDADGVVTAGLDAGQWAAAVDTIWRFGGADSGRAVAEVTFTFETRGDRAHLVSVGGGERRSPLWLTEPLVVRRSPETLVLVAGPEQRADAITRQARRAVRVVRRVLPDWRDPLVVEVPRSAEDLDRMLAADPGEYAAIAAVTATVDGVLAPGSPVHVFVNPEVFGSLEPQGAQVVMSHEAVHVATGAATSRVPLWLLEGFADYVALRDVDLPLSVTAGQIITQVRRDGPPEALPSREEFDTRTAHLGSAYEAAWIACRVLVASGGEEALVALNNRVTDGAALEDALRESFGFGTAELTRRWRQELTRIAG